MGLNYFLPKINMAGIADATYGRIVVTGVSSSGRLYLCEAVTGRSPPSRQWVARITEGVMDGHVYIVPPKEPTPEQLEQAHRLFYKAIIVDSMLGRAVAANGRQAEFTDAMLNVNPDDLPLAIRFGFVQTKGPEDDDYRTPRITAAAKVSEDGPKVAMGIVTTNGSCVRYLDPTELLRAPMYVSTYRGKAASPGEIFIPELFVPAGELGIDGRSVRDVNGALYESVNQDQVVCSSATMWNPDIRRWETDVINKLRDEMI